MNTKQSRQTKNLARVLKLLRQHGVTYYRTPNLTVDFKDAAQEPIFAMRADVPDAPEAPAAPDAPDYPDFDPENRDHLDLLLGRFGAAE